MDKVIKIEKNLAMKIVSKIVLIVALFLLIAYPSYAQGNQINIYFFWGDGCPHCAEEKPFLENLEKKYSNVKVHDFETWGSSQNRELLARVGDSLQMNIQGVPFTVVGEKYFTGWLSEVTTGKDIEDAVVESINGNYHDVVGEILSTQKNLKAQNNNLKEPKQNITTPTQLDLPIVGIINLKSLSLPLLTIVLGALDGFNPCAMWTLLFLISLLLGMKNKKRRWLLGITFIVASAFVYFLFMAAWLNLLLFVGFIVGVKLFIGIVAIAGGSYNLKEFFTNKNSACKVTGGEKRKAVFDKLREITHEKHFVIAFIGIVLLAFAVNLVELICSAGLPVIFTQLLTLSDLSPWQYYAYMLLYIFVFMLDDLFVFIVSMITLEMTGITTKYSRISHLIGGILMVIIGLLLIFKPELLMFG